MPSSPKRAAWLASACLLLLVLTSSARAQEIDISGPLAGEPSYAPSGIDVVRLDGGAVLPFVAIAPVAGAPLFAGGGARIAVSPRLHRQLWFEGDLFALLLADDARQMVMTGTTAVVRWHPAHRFGAGVGLTAGHLAAGGHAYLTESAFVGPVVIPASVWFGGGHLELRLPLWFAKTKLDGVPALRPALIAPQVTLAFGGPIVPPMYHYDGGRSAF